ncbi:MAG: DUF4388 domain-containing protein [Thermoanaerobaculales bacterium]|nr:DUF4388 domain-containing protein [Thermoanaerobaculales bacterium]
MNDGSGITGYEEERALLKRYLSDEIAPMIFADNASELFEVPPQIVGQEIQSWLGDQIRGASTMTASELLYHAATKLHQLGVLELIPREEVGAFLAKLQPFLLELCPPEQKRGLEENFGHLEKSTGISGGRVEVLHKQGVPGAPGGHGGAPGAGYGGPAGPVGGGGYAAGGAAPAAADALALHRLNLMLDQLQKLAVAGGATGGGAPNVNQKAVLGHVVEQFASQANSTKELETQLGYLQDIGIKNLGADLFKHLSEGLPDWAPPSHTEVGDKEPPAGATRAMRKVVNLSKDPEELLGRFKEMVGVAIEEFNTGSLGRSVTMLDLAERMIAQKEVEPLMAGSVIEESYSKLDMAQVNKLADDPDNRMLLRRVMKFFPKLQVEELLQKLMDEQDREKRLQFLKLLRAHGDEAREKAVEALDESVNGDTRQPWHVERNLVYLMRAIPRAHDEDIEREIDLLVRVSDLTGSMQVIREAIASLVQLDHPRAHTTLAARISELENVLVGDSVIEFDLKEIRWLLSNAIKLLSGSDAAEARSIIITHGLKDKPELGDTYARLVPLGDHDLSDTPDQLNRLLDAIQNELPRKFLGVSVKNPRKSQILEYLISAVSGTNATEVHTVLNDIVQRFADQPFGKAADKALLTMGQASKTKKPEPAANDSVTLSGDLALFGLPNVLQNLSDAGVTGAIKILEAEGGEKAEIRLAGGNLISAMVGQLKNDDAVYQLLERPMKGRFVFVNEEHLGGDQAPPKSSMEMMSLLLEGMRRYDEFNRALALIPDDARFKSTGKKPSDVKEDGDPKLAKAVWGHAARGVPPSKCESEIPIDCFRIRRLYEHWVTEGALVPADAPAATPTAPPTQS